MNFLTEKELIRLFYDRGLVSRQDWNKHHWQQTKDYVITDWIRNPVGKLERVASLNDRGKILAQELITIKHHDEAFTRPGLAICVKQMRSMNLSKYTSEQFKYGLKFIFGRDVKIKDDYPSEGCVTAIIDNAEDRFLRFSNYINWHVDKDPEAIKNPVAKEIWLSLSKQSDLFWDNHCVEVSGWGFSNYNEEAESESA